MPQNPQKGGRRSTSLGVRGESYSQGTEGKRLQQHRDPRSLLPASPSLDGGPDGRCRIVTYRGRKQGLVRQAQSRARTLPRRQGDCPYRWLNVQTLVLLIQNPGVRPFSSARDYKNLLQGNWPAPETNPEANPRRGLWPWHSERTSPPTLQNFSGS